MPLYIRDPAVEELAWEAMRLIKAKSLTETVRYALSHEIERQRASLKPSEIIDQIREKYKDVLPERRVSTPEDDKRFFDEMWGE